VANHVRELRGQARGEASFAQQHIRSALARRQREQSHAHLARGARGAGLSAAAGSSKLLLRATLPLTSI
jgi:hypothetical protein